MKAAWSAVMKALWMDSRMAELMAVMMVVGSVAPMVARMASEKAALTAGWKDGQLAVMKAALSAD